MAAMDAFSEDYLAEKKLEVSHKVCIIVYSQFTRIT